MFSFRVLIDLRFIKMLLKHPEVNNNDSTWVRLKFFVQKNRERNGSSFNSDLKIN